MRSIPSHLRSASFLMATLMAASAWTSAAPAQRTDVNGTLARAGTYVTRFISTFANAVTEETYTQELAHVGDDARALAPTQRTLRSEFLMLRATAIEVGWMPFRNVLEVNGRPVHNTDERLAAILATPSADALARAQRITAEWTRYNIGPNRTINSPVLALLFLQPDIQPRFRFKAEKPDREVPVGVSVVSYQEVSRPTIIRTPEPRPGGVDYNDSPASGRFWIDTDGTVLRSELIILGGTRSLLRLGTAGRAAVFTTVFQRDDGRRIAVPTEMRERLSTADAVLTGTARYGGFTTFAVNTDSAVVGRSAGP